MPVPATPSRFQAALQSPQTPRRMACMAWRGVFEPTRSTPPSIFSLSRKHEHPAAIPATQRKIGEDETPHEAMHCLKRQVAKRLWRTVRDDAMVIHVALEALDGAGA